MESDRRKRAIDILFLESLTFLSRDSRISEYIAGEILSRHFSLTFSCRTSVNMINSPNVSPPPPYRIFDKPMMSMGLSWASPASPLGVPLPGSGFPASPSPNISVFSPRPPLPTPPLRSRRRSATVSATTRRYPSLLRFPIHQEEEDDKAASPDLHLIRQALPISSGVSQASSSTTFSFSKEGSGFRSQTITALSSVSQTPTDDLNHASSTTFNHTLNDGLPLVTMPLPVRASPQSATDGRSLATDRVYSLERKTKPKQRTWSSTILTNLLDPLTLGSPTKPKVGQERISPPLDTLIAASGVYRLLKMWKSSRTWVGALAS